MPGQSEPELYPRDCERWEIRQSVKRKANDELPVGQNKHICGELQDSTEELQLLPPEPAGR